MNDSLQGSRLARFFPTLPLAESERTRLADRLHTILRALTLMMAGLTIAYLVLQIDHLAPSMAITVGSALFYLALIALLQRGYTKLVGVLLILELLILIGWIALNFDGIHDTSLISYFLLVAIAGLLLGGRAALLTSLLSILALAAVYLIDNAVGGVQLPQVAPSLKLLEMGAFLAITGLVLQMTISDLHKALQRAQWEAGERRIAEASLIHRRDQLEERLAERTAELAQAKDELHALIQSSQDGIIFLGDGRRLSVINARARRLLQLPGTTADWDNRPVQDLVDAISTISPEAGNGAAHQLLSFARGQGAAEEGVFQLPPYTLHWSRNAVRMRDDELAHLIVLHDISGEEQAQQMREDLVRAMVHDLRNPLTSLTLTLKAIDLLDKRQEGPPTAQQRTQQRRHLQRAQAGLEQMVELVDNILDLSRLESGQMPLQLAEIQPEDLLQKAVEGQATLAAEKGQRLSCATAGSLPPVSADPALLERVLQNLVDNAIKFTPPGGRIKISGRTLPRDEESFWLEIAVSDSGPGISPEVRQALFQKFAAGPEEAHGTGLGLAFCKLAVEAHAGQIWAESEPGSGTTFTFILPSTPDGDLPHSL